MVVESSVYKNEVLDSAVANAHAYEMWHMRNVLLSTAC